MAFAYTEKRRAVVGDRQKVTGSFTNGGADTGGNITTGLNQVEEFHIQLTGAAVGANVPVVNETLPLAGGVVTIVTDADADGEYTAIGY